MGIRLIKKSLFVGIIMISTIFIVTAQQKEELLSTNIFLNGKPDYRIPNAEHRAYIPNDVVKGFLSSHSIENYKWIFTRTENNKGYVTPRD